MKSAALTYVLITPARNEDAFLELTIQSVIKQTQPPLRWIIVSDASTDRTDEIARHYASLFPWIELVRIPDDAERTFAAKVRAFNAGYERVRHLQFDIVGSLDADITFPEDYFSYLLEQFAADPKLGLGGTPFSEHGLVYDYRFTSIEHVSGACQLFRRECYEAIGGYTPIKGGGIDVVAVLSSRMKGWHTRSFLDRVCVHHRPMGSANQRNRFAASYKLGQRAYRLGYHPFWQVFRSVYQMTKPPYVIGGISLCAGYFALMLRRGDRPVSRELIEFQQQDQMRRLREFFLQRLLRRKCAVAAAPSA